MSTTLWVSAPTPPAIDDVIASLDRADEVALADGSAWPKSVLVYRRGASSRGVQVSHDGAKVALRLLALSAPADYELAFALAEALGGDGEIEVEAGDPVPAREVRARLGGAWMVRDLAAGVTAIRAALATGGTVHIDGPVRGLELTPAALAADDPMAMIEVLRRAQIDLDEEHRAALTRDEQAAPPIAQTPAKRRSLIGFLLLVLIIGPPALVVRLLTIPLRGWLRDRTHDRSSRRFDRRREGIAKARAGLDAAPDDVDARHAYAVWHLWSHPALADRELCECLRRLETGAIAKTTPGIVWNNLAVTRHNLKLPRLAAQAIARAKELGFTPRRGRALRFYGGAIAGMFVVIAGLAPD